MSTGKAKPGLVRKKNQPPSKVWREKKNGALKEKEKIAKEANAIQAMAGGRGVNPSARVNELPQNGGQEILPLVEQTAIPIVAKITTNELQSLALGAILQSMAKGFGKKNPNAPWFAFNYLVQVYEQALAGTVPALTEAPRWFWETVHMLRPKSARMKTGSIAYAWDYQAIPVSPQLFLGLGYNLYWGVPSFDPPTEYNGFLTLVDPPAYDSKAGENAFQSTFNFFADVGMFQRVPDPGESSHLYLDVSAFQASYPEWGASSLAASTGLATSILSEVVLRNPMLAKFAGYQSGSSWRGFQHMHKNAGTPCYIAPRIATMMHVSEMATRHSPIFKFYNFDHFFCQLSFTLAKALELASRQNATLAVSCPLTPWEAQMVLRQAMLNKFSNQFAQDLFQFGDSTIPMTPLVVGPNGVSIIGQGFTEPVYPRLFAETIRAIDRKVIKLRGKQNVTFVPVLARPSDVPQMGNFQYYTPAGEGEYLPVYESTRTSVDISLIDMSYPDVMPKQYITPNSTQLTELVTSWNSWIRSLQPFLTALTSLGNESGIAALNTVFCTQHIVYIPPSPAPTNPNARDALANVPKARRKSLQLAEGQKLERKLGQDPRPVPGGTAEYYATNRLESITSTTPILRPVMKYFSVMVKPSYIANTGSVNEASVPFQQTLQVEPFAIPQSYTAEGFQTNSSETKSPILGQFVAAATYDTRQLLAQPSEVEIDLDQMQKDGNGGFFTNLAGHLGQSLGWAGAGEFFDQVGRIIDV